jgi:hypothetical protein
MEEKLAGHIFDCSDYRQADTFVNTHKCIANYVGAEYREGGDIRSSLIHEAKIAIPIPLNPTVADPDNLTPDEHAARMIFKGELGTFVKRKLYRNQNIQKAYALVIGQCTDLVQSKLKQQTKWNQDYYFSIRRSEVSTSGTISSQVKPILSLTGLHEQPQLSTKIPNSCGRRHVLSRTTT